MSRVIAFEAPPGKPILRGQEHYWAVIRTLDQEGPWTIAAVLANSNSDRSTIAEYLRRLIAGGFVVSVAVDASREKHYRIALHQLPPPVVRRDGSAGRPPGRGQTAMWNVIRGPLGRGGFTFKDLSLYASTATVAVSRVAASRYVGHLARAGYFVLVRKGGPGKPAIWRLKPAMGGLKPPIILRAHIVFDQNRGEAIGPVDAREVEP